VRLALHVAQLVHLRKKEERACTNETRTQTRSIPQIKTGTPPSQGKANGVRAANIAGAA
jgi:hypothetical protein